MALSGGERQRRYREAHPLLTERDRLVMCKALAYAIVTIERLPRQQQEVSDKEAMLALLDQRAPANLGTEWFLERAIKNIDGTEFTA